MTNGNDDTIRAKVLAKMDRKGYYYPKAIQVDNLATAAVATHDEGRAKELVHDMARDESTPVRYRDTDESVCLEKDSQSWAAATVARFDGDQLEWDQKQRLNGE